MSTALEHCCFTVSLAIPAAVELLAKSILETKVTEFLKGKLEGTGFLGVVEESSKFGFGSRGNNFLQDMAGHMDGAIEDWVRS
jgi:hypothetical protein